MGRARDRNRKPLAPDQDRQGSAQVGSGRDFVTVPTGGEATEPGGAFEPLLVRARHQVQHGVRNRGDGEVAEGDHMGTVVVTEDGRLARSAVPGEPAEMAGGELHGLRRGALLYPPRAPAFPGPTILMSRRRS